MDDDTRAEEQAAEDQMVRLLVDHEHWSEQVARHWVLAWRAEEDRRGENLGQIEYPKQGFRWIQEQAAKQ